MQKKNDNFLEKIVKKDYNNELEKVLEKKYFDENVKSILLSILYKIEGSYHDYKNVKQNVDTKEQFIERIINTIQNNCDEIKLIKPNSEESKIIGNRTFLVEKRKKRIICYNVERKLLYCIAKIAKKDKIINDKYFIINETLSNLINTGNNINMVEPLRDFNGYSWTSIAKEMESVEHNLIYQNLILLVGNEFLNKWIYNREIMMDYMEIFKNRMKQLYGREIAQKYIDILEKFSILLEVKFDSKSKERYQNIKRQIEENLEEIKDNAKYIEKITKEKRNLTRQIRKIDETIHDKKMLQEEYESRNRLLPLEEKIFSVRILSKLMIEERENKIQELEKLNDILKPEKFVKYKKDLQEKENILKILNVKDIQKAIDKFKLELQELFLTCFEIKMDKLESKQELVKLIYEFRYYSTLPYSYERTISEKEELQEKLEYLSKKLLAKAHKDKVIQKFSNREDVDYELLKKIFTSKSINLQEIAIKLTKEKEGLFVQEYDDKTLEEKYKMKKIENIKNKDFEIRYNKKVKAFY